MDRITSDPNIQEGEPCVAGTRVTVRAIKEFSAAGYSVGAILREYPGLVPEDVEAAVMYTAPDDPHVLAPLTDEERAVTRAIVEEHRLKYPFAVHLARVAIAAVNEFRSGVSSSPSESGEG